MKMGLLSNVFLLACITVLGCVEKCPESDSSKLTTYYSYRCNDPHLRNLFSAVNDSCVEMIRVLKCLGVKGQMCTL